MFFMDVFDQIPTNTENFGSPGDRHPMKQIDRELSKTPGMSPLALCEREFGPPERLAIVTENTPYPQIQKAGPCSYGNHAQKPIFRAFFPMCFPAVALGTPLDCAGDFCLKNNGTLHVLRRNVLDSSEAKGMIEQ